MRATSSRRTGAGALTWLGALAVVAGGILLLMPVLWIVSTSLKPLDRVFELPIQWVPRPLQWDNYARAWGRFDFSRYFANSALVSGLTTLLNVFLSSLAGYSLAKHRYVGRRVLFLAILGTFLLPIEALMVPTFLIVRDVGWLNTYAGLVVPMAADAFGVFFMRQFMLDLPDSLIEAARIDGAGEVGTYCRVVVPLSWPAMLALALCKWRETWDAFVWPFVLVTEDRLRTVPLGIHRFHDEYVTNYSEVMAISILALLPMLLLFVVFQHGFVRSVTMVGSRD